LLNAETMIIGFVSGMFGVHGLIYSVY